MRAGRNRANSSALPPNDARLQRNKTSHPLNSLLYTNTRAVPLAFTEFVRINGMVTYDENRTTIMLRAHQIALCLLPLLPSLWILIHILSIDFAPIYTSRKASSNVDVTTSTGAQLLLFTVLGMLGYLMTNRLVPNIKCYMIKRGICGKDLGKKGSQNEDVIV